MTVVPIFSCLLRLFLSVLSVLGCETGNKRFVFIGNLLDTSTPRQVGKASGVCIFTSVFLCNLAYVLCSSCYS